MSRELGAIQTNEPNILIMVTRIAKEATWAPIAVYAAHKLAAEWIDHEPYLDPVIHFAGGAAIALFFFNLIASWQRCSGRKAVAKPELLAFGLAVFVAVAWELMEYCLLVNANWARGWHLFNTLRDLALGSVGAAMLLVWLQRRQLQS